MHASKPSLIVLSDLEEQLDAHVQSDFDAGVSEVVRALLCALDREEAAPDAILRQHVQKALDDPRPLIPADQAFADRRAYHVVRMRAAECDA